MPTSTAFLERNRLEIVYTILDFTVKEFIPNLF